MCECGCLSDFVKDIAVLTYRIDELRKEIVELKKKLDGNNKTDTITIPTTIPFVPMPIYPPPIWISDAQPQPTITNQTGNVSTVLVTYTIMEI